MKHPLVNSLYWSFWFIFLGIVFIILGIFLQVMYPPCPWSATTIIINGVSCNPFQNSGLLSNGWIFISLGIIIFVIGFVFLIKNT